MIWTNVCLLFTGPRKTIFIEILIIIQHLPNKKMIFKMSSARWWQCFLSLNVLNVSSSFVSYPISRFSCFSPFVWWRHQMETFSALLVLNKRLSKQPWSWWFETPSRSLWCHCNVKTYFVSSRFLAAAPHAHATTAMVPCAKCGTDTCFAIWLRTTHTQTGHPEFVSTTLI